MTFLNPAILIGLVAVSIPIIIHLLHRRNAKMVDWAAMRFLRDSLAARNRRILLEEMLLMALRCVAVALLVMAAARPFLPAQSAIPWMAVLPAALAGAACAGVGTVMWSHRRAAWLLIGLAVLLLGGSAGSAVAAHFLQDDRWSSGTEARDIALVIDGSMSMSLKVDGRTNFQRALNEAAVLIKRSRPDDAFCVIEAGALPIAATSGPIRDREKLREALGGLQPTGGSMDLLKNLTFAAARLLEGQNPGKEIVLLTDGQQVGWSLDNRARWQFLASTLDRFGERPGIVCRTFPLPTECHNCAVGDATRSRRVVGMDRPVHMGFQVLNAGTGRSGRLVLRLSVDDAPARSRQLAPMRPGASEEIEFAHRFLRPGAHVVRAALAGRDQLRGDDEAAFVVNVLESLPVLIVEGAPTGRPLAGAASFMDVALAPMPGEEGEEEAGRRAGEFVDTTVVPITEIARVRNLADYSVVILADVPRLPEETVGRLQVFVREGGGLLVAPGRRADREFYNGWQVDEGRPMMPAVLVERKDVGEDEEPVTPAVKTISHPALSLVADTDRSDLGSAVIRSYWRLHADESHGKVIRAAALSNGEPFVIEGKVGRGRVLMTALSLDHRDSSLPTLHCYVPMVHELVYHLAAPRLPQLNVSPGSPVSFPLSEQMAAEVFGSDGPSQERSVEVLTPWNAVRSGALQPASEGWRLSFAGTREPGLYHFSLPPAPGKQKATRLPFTVPRKLEESLIASLSEHDLKMPREYVELMTAASSEDLVDVISGDVPGREIWRRLLFCVILALLLEIALSRWITLTRRTQRVREVEFGRQVSDPETLRARFEQQRADALAEARESEEK